MRRMDRDRRARRFAYGPSVLATLAVVAVAVALYLWWRGQQPPEITADVPVAAQPAPAAPAPPAAAEPPPIQHPIEPLPEPLTTGASGEKAVDKALDDLLGHGAVRAFVQSDNFIGRVVATVDNLARPHAAVQLWPVIPAGGRFTVEQESADARIAAANTARYTGLVDFLVGVDTARAVALYRRFYPRFQRAYEELGYPGRYFNDRLVEVIDHLLATPEPEPPLGVTLTEIKGPMPSTRPWVHYEFTDPEFAALSSGQKIMVRVGLANERRLKAKLTEIRREIARQAQAPR